MALFSHRTLFGALLAGAVAGTACSRPDRTESGSDTTAAVLPDTSSYAPPSSGIDTASGAASDTAKASQRSSGSTQPGTAAPSNAPRAATAPARDSDAAGYRPMERDTTDVPGRQLDSARVTADTAEASAASSDTSVSLSPESGDTAAIEASRSEMARDTSTAADQLDAEVSAESSEAIVVDSTITADVAVTTDNEGRIRPPEDSTETYGQDLAGETADEQIVAPEDRETMAVSEISTDQVGAAAIAGNVTGAEAVALTSRQGVSCTVVDPEVNEAVRWDMSSTPVTLNPCGMGSMVPSRIWTEK